jgi:hypothetical protein
VGRYYGGQSWERKGQSKKKDQSLTIEKIDCNIMLVNTRSKVGLKKQPILWRE